MLAGICSTMEQDEIDETFFVDRGEGARKAKAICRNCPLIKQCSQFAINYPTELDGIWGGTTVRERRRLRKLFGIKQERVTTILGDNDLTNVIV